MKHCEASKYIMDELPTRKEEYDAILMKNLLVIEWSNGVSLESINNELINLERIQVIHNI